MEESEPAGAGEWAGRRSDRDAYRRLITLTAAPGLASAELVDDFHHFRVRLHHNGGHVQRVEAESVRYPWTTCPAAGGRLSALEGMPLSPRASAVGEWTRARENCTHMFDLAGLAVAHAASTREQREYLAIVPDRVEGLTRPTLQRDGVLVQAWTLRGGTITDPPPYAGRRLRDRFISWADESLDADEAEAATVLRRACYISYGRQQDLSAFATAAQLLPSMAGTCYTFTSGIAEKGRRVSG